MERARQRRARRRPAVRLDAPEVEIAEQHAGEDHAYDDDQHPHRPDGVATVAEPVERELEPTADVDRLVVRSLVQTPCNAPDGCAGGADEMGGGARKSDVE